MADDNIGNDDVTAAKDQNNFDRDLDSGLQQAQNLYNNGSNLADKINDYKSKSDQPQSGNQSDNQSDQKKEADNAKKPTSEDTPDAKKTDQPVKKGADEAAKKGGEKTAEKGSEKVAEKSAEKAAEAGAEKAAQKTAEKVAEKVAEKAVEAGAVAVGSALAPGVGAVIGKVVGKTIVPLFKVIIMISIFGGLLSSFVIQSLPSYIFNPTLGLNPDEHKVSTYADYFNTPKPESTYKKATDDVKKEIEKGKTDQKLSGSVSMDVLFLYACYSASQEQYAKCPEDEGKLKISYKIDMIIKILKVLPRALIKAVIGSTGTTSGSGGSSGTTGSVTGGDVGGGDYTSGSITQLVNKFHSIDSSYEPTDLEQTCDSVGDPEYLRSEANQAYSAMWLDAQSKGFTLISQSGYRSYSLQESLYGDGSDNSVAKPGQSEHQLGLALDISCSSEGGQLEESFGSTPEGKYVEENAATFGFIIRYPKGKESYTGYPYEPWHVRYVGVETAKAIKESGLTMEGYFAQKSGITVTEPATTGPGKTPTSTVSPFKKELIFEAFFGTKVKLSDKMEGSSKTYEEYIMYLAESLKRMLNINGSTITIGGFGGMYAWPIDKPFSEFTLADDEDWGERVHPISGDIRFHYGIDLSDALGSNIYAAQAGTVTLAGWNGGYGNYIRIDHGNGVVTFYGHLSEIKVKQDDKVTKGQLIGLMGSTGDSTGSHLHFGCDINGETADPLLLYKTGGDLSEGDYSDLLKIVEAEATNQGYEGKLAVTQVIMFRVQVTGASYHDVIFADGQFSPITDGRFDSAVPTDETVQAVNAALAGEQVVNPRCYFFYNPDASYQDWSGDSSKIFDRRVGDHMFYLSTVYQ